MIYVQTTVVRIRKSYWSFQHLGGPIHSPWRAGSGPRNRPALRSLTYISTSVRLTGRRSPSVVMRPADGSPKCIVENPPKTTLRGVLPGETVPPPAVAVIRAPPRPPNFYRDIKVSYPETTRAPAHTHRRTRTQAGRRIRSFRFIAASCVFTSVAPNRSPRDL